MDYILKIRIIEMPIITRSMSMKPVENTESLDILCYIALMDEATLKDFKKFISNNNINGLGLDQVKQAFEKRTLGTKKI